MPSIETTEFGTSIVSRYSHPQKAPSHISLILLGSKTVYKLVHPQNVKGGKIDVSWILQNP
jgi:hypothetical protein